MKVSDFIRELLEREKEKTGDTFETGEELIERRAVDKLMELHQQGVSYTMIAKMLNREGIPSKRGKEWYASTVSYVVKHRRKNSR